MGAENDQDDQETTEESEGTGSGQGERVFTQAELDEIVSKRVRSATRTATEAKAKEIADLLGVPLEQAKELVEKHKQADEATKTEAERLRDEAARDRAEAQALMSEALKSKQEADLSRSLLSGATPVRTERLELATRLALQLVDDDAEDPLGAAIEAVREASPEWFQIPDQDSTTDRKTKTPPPPARTTGQRQQGAGDQAVTSSWDRWKERAGRTRIA
jgi:DNA-binding transcriptional MerR regulator